LPCVVDLDGFEVALPPKRPDSAADAEPGEPVAVCRRCGSTLRRQGAPASADGGIRCVRALG
jgi:hypothetical protein